MEISTISNVENLKTNFTAENNKLVNKEWENKGFSKKEKNQVKEYLINQQYSAELGLGNFLNTINVCRTVNDSIVKVVCVSYKKADFENSVSFVGHIDSCHHNLQIGSGSIIYNILDQHYTRISRSFVKLFQEVYGEISNIKIASIEIDKSVSPLLNAITIEEFRYASQCYYDDSTPDIQWGEACVAFNHL